jgi:2-dehydro-3-deoxyphosphogluconate aldolase / (4S)-4-hydroxy-2-oxoglutarate aldolase
MRAFKKEEIIFSMIQTGMIPVFYNDDLAPAEKVLDASYAAGVRVFEFTNRGDNAFQVFTNLLEHGSKYPDLKIGIGTIMDAATTLRYLDAGAHFIVSPILKLEMAIACQKRNALWIPGCATLTEIVTAKENGASIIKLFPGSVLGPGFVSSVLPVVRGLQLMPTGGVEPTLENLSKWFNAGVVCVGMGSQLFKKEIIEAKDWTTLEKNISDVMSLIKMIRD